MSCVPFIYWLAALVQDTPSSVSFLDDVRPILVQNCLACHGADEDARQADLRLDQPVTAPPSAIVPGDPAASDVIQRIMSDDPDLKMPPDDSGRAITPAEIDVLRRWISEGAKYETHWSFIAPRPADRPQVATADWCRNDIDYFIADARQHHGLEPSPVADPYTLIRRVHLDLTGLPPTPEVADAFAADPSDAAWAAIVDELLASPQFGEHWARMWLDLARYADTKGYEKDQPREIWRYRDWVIAAFNADMPFDQFTTEQLAGDLLANPTTDQRLATAFHRNTLTNDEGGTDNEEFRTLAVKDRVDTTMQVWMGLTAGCAKCHSHKYDPISQREYYQLYAYFNQSEDADRSDDAPRLGTPTQQQRQQLAEWQAQLDGLPGSDPESEDSAQAVLKKQIAELKKQFPRTPIMKDLPPKKRRKTFIHTRGNFLEPGELVAPSLPAAFSTPTSDAADKDGVGDRLHVARWLVSESNPLTSRVLVNRLWARIFGRGFVETEEDFGTQGSPPSHPELLDWLAVKFRTTHQWSVKRLCRQIVMSATYRQSSSGTRRSHDADPENIWLARGARFRLTAESVRDQALFAAGLLSKKIGGPSVMPPQPEGIWRTTYSTLKWETPTDENRYRRGLYTFLRRTSPYPSLIAFDAGSGEVCQIRRIRTNTPLQALITMNDPVYFEAAGGLAVAVSTDVDPLTSLFRRVLIRPPQIAEHRRLEELLNGTTAEFQSDPQSAVQLLTSAGIDESVPKAQHVQLASLTVIANVMLNLDETIMKP
jgi:Protein of unknown function (DUF1553)/Protein of unknown function (DUF1549)/Planctomycete cytochrome C